MAENKPGSPHRKLGLLAPATIAGIVVLIVLAAILLQYRSDPRPKPAPPPPQTAAPPPVDAKTPEDKALSRTEIVKEADAIAAAYAAGGDTRTGVKDPLAGRAFALRIPFGCDGPQVRPGAAQAFYEYDLEKRTVRLVARAANWTTLPMMEDVANAGVETIEGFWIPHPWTYSDRCPKRRDGSVPATPTPPAAQTLGLARQFEAGGSRVTRRGERPYEHVLKLEADEQPPLQEGYRLVLEGRFATFSQGRVARCWSETPDHRPVCLYAVEFSRVAFEGSGGRLIAEWRD